MENSLERDLPENGCMIYKCDIEGDASSGICRPIESSFASASIIGCALPSVRADVASALNSRVREIAMRIKPAAIGASSNFAVLPRLASGTDALGGHVAHYRPHQKHSRLLHRVIQQEEESLLQRLVILFIGEADVFGTVSLLNRQFEATISRSDELDPGMP